MWKSNEAFTFGLHREDFSADYGYYESWMGESMIPKYEAFQNYIFKNQSLSSNWLNYLPWTSRVYILNIFHNFEYFIYLLLYFILSILFSFIFHFEYFFSFIFHFEYFIHFYISFWVLFQFHISFWAFKRLCMQIIQFVKMLSQFWSYTYLKVDLYLLF